MSSFNQVILLANLTRDPATKQLGSGSSVTEFGVACNRKFKTSGGEEREEVLFADCSAFGRTGEVIAQYFRKGKPIFLTGRLKYDAWEKDGQKRSKLSIVVDEFQFVGAKDGGTNGSAEPYTPPPARPQPPPKKSVGANGEPDDLGDFKEADIPF